MLLTQAQVEEELQRLVGRMEELTSDHAKLAMEQAEAEVAWKRIYALCFLGDSGSVADRTQRAQVRGSFEYERYRLKSAELESLKQALRSTENQMGVLRTIAANVRGQT